MNGIIFEIVRWLNLFGLSTLFPSVWVEIGNYLEYPSARNSMGSFTLGELFSFTVTPRNFICG